MNWEAISAVGESIAAMNTFQAISGASSDITLRLAESPELSEVMTKFLSGPENFTERESMQMQLVLRSAFRNYENYYYQHKRGFLEDDMWVGYRSTILEAVTRGFGEAWWKTHQVAFGKSFVDFVNSNIEQHGRQESPWERFKFGSEVNDA